MWTAIRSGSRAPRFLALAVAALLPLAPVAAQQKAPAPADGKPQWKLNEPFRDCPACPVVVPIAAGLFQMGVPDGEDERERVPQPFRGTSKPLHPVRIKAPFAIGKYEVTRAEFAEFVADTKHNTGDSCLVFAPERDAPLLTKQRIDRSATFAETTGRSWRNPGFQQTDQDPVVCVNWNDAKAYVDWLSRKTRQRYELPSEAEWEYAARGNSAAARYWGEGVGDICSFANAGDLTLMRTPGVVFEKNTPYFACEDKFSFTAPVGKLKPNPLGLHDVLGNVAEWVEDCWNESYAKAPDEGEAWTLGDCKRRVVRGGSWFNGHSRIVRSGSRVSHIIETRISATGFRVVRRL